MNNRLTTDDSDRSEVISKDGLSSASNVDVELIPSKESTSDNDSQTSKNKEKKVKFNVSRSSVSSGSEIKVARVELKKEKEVISRTPKSQRSSFRRKRYECEFLQGCNWETFSIIMRTQLQHTQENKLKNGAKINENEYDKRQIKDLDGKKSSNSNERENCCESYSKCLVF